MAEKEYDNSMSDILDEIRAELKENGPESYVPDFEDTAFREQTENCGEITGEEFERNLRHVNLNFGVEAYRPLPGSRISVFFRKILRKLIKFYIEPVVADQNELNLRYARMFSYMNSQLESSRKHTEELEKRIAVLEKENEELRK